MAMTIEQLTKMVEALNKRVDELEKLNGVAKEVAGDKKGKKEKKEKKEKKNQRRWFRLSQPSGRSSLMRRRRFGT
jgi:hypothetical protein